MWYVSRAFLLYAPVCVAYVCVLEGVCVCVCVCVCAHVPNLTDTFSVGHIRCSSSMRRLAIGPESGSIWIAISRCSCCPPRTNIIMRHRYSDCRAGLVGIAVPQWNQTVTSRPISNSKSNLLVGQAYCNNLYQKFNLLNRIGKKYRKTRQVPSSESESSELSAPGRLKRTRAKFAIAASVGCWPKIGFKIRQRPT